MQERTRTWRGSGQRGPLVRSVPRVAAQRVQRSLDPPAFAAEVVALFPPEWKACLDLAPETARMVGVDEMAELVYQHVFERSRCSQHQREVEAERGVGREGSPLRGHHPQ